MILSDKDICDQLGEAVVIDPFNPHNVNTSSYDVTLGDFYFIEHKPSFLNRLFWRNVVYNIWDIAAVNRVWGTPKRAFRAGDHPQYNRFKRKWWGIDAGDRVILIPPKHTILAHTVEFIGHRYSGTTMMKARSSFGRNFIEVCKCAGYGDVGYINRWTMEITNNSRFYHIPLVVGRRIAQIVFMQTTPTDGDYVTAGKYQGSKSLDALKSGWNPYVMLPRLDRDRDIGAPFLCPHGFPDWDDCVDCRH